MTIVCNMVNCRYRKAEFCGNDFVILNGAGQCNVWYDKYGRPRAQPDYREAEKSNDFLRRGMEKQKKNDTEKEKLESNEGKKEVAKRDENAAAR